jgi:hypothetical protein
VAESVIAYQALQRGDVTGFLRPASRPARGVHPPITKLLPLPMYVLFGNGTRPVLYAFTALQDAVAGWTRKCRRGSGRPRVSVVSDRVSLVRHPYAPSQYLRLGPFVLLFADRESLFVRPADPTPWPVGEVVAHIAAHGRDISGRPTRVRVAGHIPFLDGPGLSYVSVRRYGRPVPYSGLGDRSLHPEWWHFVVMVTGPVKNRVEYREPVLAILLSEERLPFDGIATIALPDGRSALLYRAAPETGDRGSAAGSTVGVPRRDGAPAELPYVYVPQSARLLTWKGVRFTSRHVAERRTR